MRKSRLSENKQQRLIEHFVASTTARVAASPVGVSKTMAAYHFPRLRTLIYEATEDLSPIKGELKVDESYFGGRRKDRRGAKSLFLVY